MAYYATVSLFETLFDRTPFRRKGEHLKEIAFPLGGIGTGCASLDGRGGLRDWEIFNRPNKGSQFDYTFPALWWQTEGEEPNVATIQGPRQKDWVGDGYQNWVYGHGLFNKRMDGLPGFDSVTFDGTFPIARLQFAKEGCPLDVELAALNPFIPNDVRSSSFPAVILVYRVTNRSDKRVSAVIAWSLQNPVGASHPAEDKEKEQGRNQPWDEGRLHGIRFSSDRFSNDEPGYGEVILATDSSDFTRTPRWSQEGWWDSFRNFWNRFRETGDAGVLSEEGDRRMPGTLGGRVDLAPGESAEIRFVLAWRFPNAVKYWGSADSAWRTHYGTVWPSAGSVVTELFHRFDELTSRTLAFEEALFDTTLPPEIVESVSATASILHSPTLTRLEDGTFWAWEGCSGQEGCCEGTCSHVWNYALTHAYLFPEIQRSFLDTAYAHSFRCGPDGEKGAMRFRVPIPLVKDEPLWHAASDGQLGMVVQVYRDWRLTGDDDWLRSIWPSVRQSLKYAWVQWDRDKDGLVDGDMHNTYDINFEGPNPLTQFFYLAALRAGAAIAKHLGEDETSTKLEGLADKGYTLTMNRLWNGEFFRQEGIFTAPETSRYQHGAGCLSDMLFGQLCASIADLGHLTDPEAIRSALDAIFRHNFRDPLGEHENLQRMYCSSDEAGLLLCTWPQGEMPFYPFVYSDEVWTGIEYQVATHLALEGRFEASRQIAKAIRDRYDGRRRNPWNEFECGSHYARALASYGLQIAFTGMKYDAIEQRLTFREEPFKGFWSVPGAWGTAERSADGELKVSVIEGALPKETLPS